MFQVEPILALQSLEWLRFPMWLVSELGRTHIYIGIMLYIVYLIDFRKGFLLIQVVSWNGLLTGLLKSFFALPRPDAVDSRVLLGGVGVNPVGFEAQGAPGFFKALPEDVVAHTRGLGEVSFGFPSGHCSWATSTWGSVALLFREPAIRALAMLLILLMPVSRMYLGRHFLAGTLGGMSLGLLVVTVAWFSAIREFDGLPTLWNRIRAQGRLWRAVAGYGYFFALPVAAMVLLHADIDDCARLLGINMGWVLLSLRGLPRDGGSASRRIMRFLLALIIFALVSMAAGEATVALSGGNSTWASALTKFVAALATLWGASELALKLNLFEGRRPAVRY
jgi:membrane-associated phospholipid phosphatase